MVTELYDKCLTNGVQEYIEQGNLKPPLNKSIVEWIMDFAPSEKISSKSCSKPVGSI